MICQPPYWLDLEPGIAELTLSSSGAGRVANVGVGEVIVGCREGLDLVLLIRAVQTGLRGGCN